MPYIPHKVMCKCPHCGSDKLTVSITINRPFPNINFAEYYCIECRIYWIYDDKTLKYVSVTLLPKEEINKICDYRKANKLGCGEYEGETECPNFHYCFPNYLEMKPENALPRTRD